MAPYLTLISSKDRDVNPPRIEFTAGKDTLTLGRERADVVLACPKDPNSLSRRHATLRLKKSKIDGRGALCLVDESSNGVLVNQKRLKRLSAYELVKGDVVVLGIHPDELTYRVDEETPYTLDSGVLYAWHGRAEVRDLRAIKKAESVLCDELDGEEGVVSLSTVPTKRDPSRDEEAANELIALLNSTFDPIRREFPTCRGVRREEMQEESFCTFMLVFKYVTELLEKQDLFLHLQSPMYVLGDLHGSFYDLQLLLEKLTPFGDIRYSAAPLCFLGDYVDRGGQGLEVVACLFAFKLLCPGTVHLLRGNHEDPRVNGDIETNSTGSFLYQCQQRFGEQRGHTLWEAANKAFQQLPLCADVDRKVFLCHGGVPRENLALLSEPSFPRFESLLEESTSRQALLARDLLWSDPCTNEDQMTKGTGTAVPDFPQSERASDDLVVAFSNSALTKFLQKECYDIMVRAHQFTKRGLRVSKRMRVITVFSCTSYCEGVNAAGLVVIQPGGVKLMSFKPPEQPGSALVQAPDLGGDLTMARGGRHLDPSGGSGSLRMQQINHNHNQQNINQHNHNHNNHIVHIHKHYHGDSGRSENEHSGRSDRTI